MALVLALACLAIICGKGIAGEPDDANAPSAAVAAAEPVDADTDPDTDPDIISLLNYKPIEKTITPADLPPSNPLTGRVSLPRSASVAFSGVWRGDRSEYRAVIEREALANGLAPALVDAVLAVESGYNPAVMGLDGEIGLMQVMPSTARMLGFAGTDAELAASAINVHYGAKYLAGAWRLAQGDLCTAVMKYRAGYGETRFSFRSVDYCLRVRSHLAAHGVAVTGTVPQPTFGEPTGAGSRGRSVIRSAPANIVALNARLRELTEKLRPRNAP